MENPKLKPCPFCGNKNLLLRAVEYDPCSNVISCNQCHMSFDMPTYVAGKKSNNRERVIETWNTRASGWILCSERMPEEFVPVLVCSEHKTVYIADWNGETWEFENGAGDYENCEFRHTHWMPIAEPPEV